jgi:glycosyltransferase involved in cell wall biosynthesis
MEYRPHYLSKEWLKNGNNVLVVASSYTHFRSKQFQLKQKFEKHKIEGIDYFIIKTPVYKGHTLKRVFNITTFVWRLVRCIKVLVNEFKPDVVIASSTYCFDIYPVKKISKISGAKLIFEVHDLWPLSPIQLGGYSKLHPFIMTMQRAENFAYKHADKVISLLPNSMEYMVEHGLKPEKFVHIPNGINTEEWNTNMEIPDHVSELIQMLRKQNKVLIGYAGTHGVANALYSLVDAMKILEKENVDLLLVGQGTEKENLIRHAKELKLQNVHFINSVPKIFIPSILNKIWHKSE